jgi:putative glycosyltransferase
LKLSIVSTLYYSSSYIDEFCDRIIKTIPKEVKEFEIILVDDGSPDNSLEVALEKKDKVRQLKIIQLSRNFGHHKAIMTGLEQSSGDFVFLIDSDLEERPELLEVFWSLYQENLNSDVIYGVQKRRKGNFFERLSGEIFYSLYNAFVDDFKPVRNISTVRLMNRAFVSNLLKFKSQDFYLAPAWEENGFSQMPYYFQKNSTSPTTYSFLKKYHLLINSIFAHSNKPLFFIFYFGFIISLLAFSFGLYSIVRRLYFGVGVEGWTTIIIAVSFFSGLIIASLGVIAIYISKIHLETKNRPFSIIKKIY